jgi:hypothetical protein
MFFPSTPHLPTTGDRVVFRFEHTPYTVAMVSPDRQMVLLEGIADPVRIETLAWTPMVGDRVEVLFAPYLRWLQQHFDKYLKLSFTDRANRADHMATVERIKGRMKVGINYRTGTIAQMDGAMVRLEFGASSEVMPITCIAVIERAKNHGQVHVAASQAA